VHFRLRVEVNATGAVHAVTVMDPIPEPLVQCIRGQVAHVALPAGEPITVQSGYSFAPGATAPVPVTR
jgi:hypothetical protein